MQCEPCTTSDRGVCEAQTAERAVFSLYLHETG